MFLSKGVRVTGLLIGLAAVAVVGETVGNTQTGTSYSPANDRCAVRVVMPEEGDITSISVYCKDPDNELGEPYIYAVYSDANNAPATRLEMSARLNLTAGTGWKSADLTSSIHVQANTVLWLALIYGDSPGVYYSSSTGGTVARSGVNWVSGTDEQNMPSSYGSVSSTETRRYCVYATYTPSTGAEPEGWSTLNGVTSTNDHVGIGTTDLYRKLTVEAGPSDFYAMSVRNGAFGALEVSANTAVAMMVNNFQNGGTAAQFWGNVDVSGHLSASGNLYMSMGNIELQSGTLKIKNWTIEAPDYVFEKDYKLPSLTAVEKHIAANKHLPGVPSAAEMKEKGVDLSEMNMTLLKKVEELTLYAIEQNKKIEALEKKISEK
jgi:hypothetical protein